MSKKALFYDTETTGLHTTENPADVIQLAMLLVDLDSRKIMTQVSAILRISRPVHPIAFGIHGMNKEFCEEWGVTRQLGVEFFRQLHDRADFLIGHNEQFDRKVMNFHLENQQLPTISKPAICTMLPMTDVCKLPGRFGKYKWPKLTEAFEFCFNKPLTGAHDAMVDIRATKDIYFWMIDQGILVP
jgi:DNA polymerase III epsilon subunit-like protein